VRAELLVIEFDISNLRVIYVFRSRKCSNEVGAGDEM